MYEQYISSMETERASMKRGGLPKEELLHNTAMRRIYKALCCVFACGSKAGAYFRGKRLSIIGIRIQMVLLLHDCAIHSSA